ncbi:MAG: PKD domain-containing protein [Candidatus Bathyarchaeia archaeon]
MKNSKLTKNKKLQKITLCLLLFLAFLQILNLKTPTIVNADTTTLQVYAEAASFARLDDIDPSGWFYQAVLYNPTNAPITVTGLRWLYNATAKIIDVARNVRCYDTRYFTASPTTYNPDDKTIYWEYSPGSITVNVPAKSLIVTWIEVPVYSVNNDGIVTTYCLQAYDGTQWLTSPLYTSHSGHDNAATTLFRADFNLTTNPTDENHAHPNPEWLFNEDRTIIAGLPTRIRLIPITMSRNSQGINYATVNITLPQGWTYTPGSAYLPYGDVVTYYNENGVDKLKWDFTKDVLKYALNTSMAQNYIEFNVTAPYVSGIHNFTVTATITSLAGRTTTENQYIYALVKTPPTANFTFTPATPLTQESVTFNATNSYDLDGTVTDYFWDFGDGANATGITANHVYADNGTYTVTLTVTDNEGLKSTLQSAITIQNRPPIAQFTKSAQIVYTGETILFNASTSFDPDGTIVSYYWDFDDETNAVGATVNHSYAHTGIYSVKLNVIDNDGASNITTQFVTVLNRLPLASITIIPAQPKKDEVVVFDASGCYDQDGVIVSYVWNFGDGNVTETSNPMITHVYTSSGTFNVTLTLIDNNGGYKEAVQTITISEDSDTSAPPSINWIWFLLVIPPLILFFGGVLWKRRNSGKNARGFDYFKEITDGGIPDSFSVLVTGMPGSGKSTLCQELAYSFLKEGNTCIYVNYDCFPNEVREDMKKFHLDMSDYEEKKKFLFIDCFSSIAKVSSKEKYSLAQPFSLADLGIIMSQVTGEAGGSPKVFFDSVVPLLTHVDPSKVVEFLQDRSARIKGVNGTFVFTVGKETIEPSLVNRLEEFVDCVIELDVNTIKGKRVRRLHVKKMRGRKPSDKWIDFEIDEKRGIVFLV